MMPGLFPEDQELSRATTVKPATGDQEVSPKLSNHTDDPPPDKRTAAPVANRSGGAKENPQKVDIGIYSAITLLDKWLLLQAIFASRELSQTAKVVAGVLLDCLNCGSGKCCPSIAYLTAHT